MAKRKNNPSPAEDYLEQVRWQQQKHARRFTAKDPAEPKWKFRVSHLKDHVPMPLKLLFILLVLAIAGIGSLALYQKYVASGSPYTLATLLAFILVVLVVWIATLDKKRKQ